MDPAEVRAKGNGTNDERVVNAKEKEKVCHGCRKTYNTDKWKEHVHSKDHQNYMKSKEFAVFCSFVEEVRSPSLPPRAAR